MNTACINGRYLSIAVICLAVGCIIGMLLPVRLRRGPYEVGRPHLRKIETLVKMSDGGESLIARWDDPNANLQSEDVPLAREYVFAFPNGSSFHILLNIRKLDLSTYSEIPDVIKVNIIIGGLALAHESDDWGGVTDLSLGEAGTSLLAVGKLAARLLPELLDDGTPIGSAYGETQAHADLTHSRRKDVAYKYMCILMGRRYVYDTDPKKRDEAIKELREELAAKK
jgi:hypothetical protein